MACVFICAQPKLWGQTRTRARKDELSVSKFDRRGAKKIRRCRSLVLVKIVLMDEFSGASISRLCVFLSHDHQRRELVAE